MYAPDVLPQPLYLYLSPSLSLSLSLSLDNFSAPPILVSWETRVKIKYGDMTCDN